MTTKARSRAWRLTDEVIKRFSACTIYDGFSTNADVRSIEVHWLDEKDPHVNPMGSKGLGEVCLVGTAAAIANAVYHATGVRVRDLPITLDKLL